MSLTSLPAELIEIVVSNAAYDRKSLIALSSSCKTLCQTAQRRLFRRVVLYASAPQRLNAALSSNPSLVAYIQRLDIIHYYDPTESNRARHPSLQLHVYPGSRFIREPSRRILPQNCDDPAITGILQKLSSSRTLRSLTLSNLSDAFPKIWSTLDLAFLRAFIRILQLASLQQLSIFRFINLPNHVLQYCKNLEKLSTQLTLFMDIAPSFDHSRDDAPPSPTTLNLHLAETDTEKRLSSFRLSFGGFSKVERLTLTFSSTLTDIPGLLSEFMVLKELSIGFSAIPAPLEYLENELKPLPYKFIYLLGSKLFNIPGAHPSLTSLGIILNFSQCSRSDFPVPEFEYLVPPLSRLHTSPGSLLKTIRLVIEIPRDYQEFDELEEDIRSVLRWEGSDEVLEVRPRSTRHRRDDDWWEMM